jgi:murein DD-endopeptidase MepM/ murein hydrolase activator NlpD
LEENKRITEQKKKELVSLTNDLRNETKIIADTVKEKNQILLETKNTESSYKKLLIAKQIEKEAFEKEILEFEETLKTIIDPNSIPTYNAGVLKWPLDHVRITQYFGNTAFAARNPQAYAGKGHNGIDFGAYIGTPVKSALSGTVIDSGNMDLANKGRCKNYGSYGKWILIKHNNGLSTLYAHLSLIKAIKGDAVSTGEIIGYSGNTGTSFGPHLHFTVFASDGVTIAKLTNSKNCKNAIIPVAPRAAYLNPLSYLPD